MLVIVSNDLMISNVSDRLRRELGVLCFGLRLVQDTFCLSLPPGSKDATVIIRLVEGA